jgi:hypothetical protein
MNDKNCRWDTFKVEGAAIADKLKDLLREGNVRRIVVEHEGRTVAEFPLTAGVFGAVLAPVLAAIAALVALLNECVIHVERVAPTAQKSARDDAPALTAH